MPKTAIYARVSTTPDKQEVLNQLLPLRKLAEARGLDVAEEYVDHVSGANSNRPAFRGMMEAAYKGSFQVLLIWSLDRLSREGIHNTLGYLRKLQANRVSILSLQEPWLDTSSQGVGELLISVFAWVAKQERERIRARINEGLATARSKGRRLGRPPGSKDRKARRKAGYALRWHNRIR